MAERPPLESFLKKSFIQKEDLEDLSPKEVQIFYKYFKGRKGDKGEAGNTLSKEELASLVKPVLAGLDIPTNRSILSQIKSLLPEVKDGITPTEKELQAIIKPLIPIVRDGSPDTGKEIIEKVNKNKGNKIKASKIEGFDEVEGTARSALKNIQNFISLGGTRSTIIKASGTIVGTNITTLNFSGATATKVGDGSEVNIATSGSGQVNSIVAGAGISVNSTDPANPIVTNTGTAPSFVDNEVVSGSGTSFTLANTPIAGSVHVHGNGQRLTGGGVDFTISGAVITTVNSFSSGTVLADYRK